MKTILFYITLFGICSFKKSACMRNIAANGIPHVLKVGRKYKSLVDSKIRIVCKDEPPSRTTIEGCQQS